MKKILLLSACLINGGGFIAKAETAELQPFQLASGYYNGLYYYSGLLISALVDNPVGGLNCGRGGSCGPKNTVILNRSSNGSMENLQALCEGKVHGALAQSNLVYMAYSGVGPFEGKACPQLRAVASLYPELLQIAVRKDSDIKALTDLKGKKLTVGSQQSGTFDSIREILAAAGLSLEDIKMSHESLQEAAELFEKGDIDAFAFFAGSPTPLFTNLNQKVPLRFLTVEGNGVEKLLSKSPYYQEAEILAGSYQGVSPSHTVSVHALFVTTEKTQKNLIYEMTSALWKEKQRPAWFSKLLIINGGFTVEHSLDGIGIPLHDGAKQYYNEIGKRY